MPPPKPEAKPSEVATTEATTERPMNVFTEEPAVTAARKQAESASGKKPDQTSDGSDASPDNQETGNTGRRRGSRKLARLYRKLEDADERDTAQAAEIESLQARIDTLEKADPKPEPELKDFKSGREYHKAMQKWEADATAAAKPKPRAKPRPDPDHSDTQPSPYAAADLKALIKDGKKRFGEKFEDAWDDKDLAINKVIGDFLLDSDFGAELLIHLHEKPELAKEIVLETKKEATSRLELLEETLEKAAKEGTRGPDGKFKKPDPNESQTVKTKSKAPTAPSDSERGTTIPEADLETADMDTYAAHRTAENLRHGLKR